MQIYITAYYSLCAYRIKAFNGEFEVYTMESRQSNIKPTMLFPNIKFIEFEFYLIWRSSRKISAEFVNKWWTSVLYYKFLVQIYFWFPFHTMVLFCFYFRSEILALVRVLLSSPFPYRLDEFISRTVSLVYFFIHFTPSVLSLGKWCFVMNTG